MAKTSEFTFVLKGASPDQVLAVLSSAEFEVTQQASQDGNKSCEVVEVSRDDKRLVYELHTVEYAKGITGIDRSKTINTTTVVTWDLGAQTSRWVYSGPHGKRARVSGGTTLTASGEDSRVRTRLDIEIKVPLVGGQIENLVVRATEKHWPSYERIVRQSL
ncbi:MAG: DUF2505 family protein [Nannocystaceae bacterium]|nr:DUF2505 family protein [Nannocystaceae bacterium]